VVNGDKAELRPVKAGAAHEGVTVIEQGLKSGETVVIDGQMRVVPGDKVMVKQPGEKQGPVNTDKSSATAGTARL
jgi:membrane fusion protein, multidrug efflux system